MKKTLIYNRVNMLSSMKGNTENGGRYPNNNSVTARLMCFVFSSVLISATTEAQTTFYDPEVIQKIEIGFNQPNWDYMLDTSKVGEDGYLIADWVKLNGVLFDSAGIKYKGNSSYDSSYLKNPIHIALDEFKSQSYQGITDIKLSNGHSDPSMIREVLAYRILQNYMDCPDANFAQVYINGSYIGLYTNVENINAEFCSDHFYSSTGTLIKASPADPGPYSRSNLKYISGDSSDYFNLYEIKSDYGWNELVMLCSELAEEFPDMDSLFDADRILWMLAFNNLLVNLDSYSGAFAQNYYLYRDKHEQFNPIVWDLNMAFGGFPFIGLQGGGMGSLGVQDMQNLTTSLHFNDSDWPLIRKTMNNSRNKKKYYAHLRTMTVEMISDSEYASIAGTLQALTDTAVQSDVNKFFSYEQFLGSMNTNIQFGSYIIPGISVLMEERLNFLLNTQEFSYVFPVISDVSTDIPNPSLNTEVTFTANVQNATDTSVLIGYRFNRDDNFGFVLMLDDGIHGDGNSNDGVFGQQIVMSGEWMDYYVVAENEFASAFSPERAEFEFYSLKADIVTVNPGDIVINEFLSLNQNDTVDENGQHEDWIEFYNNTDSQVSLFGLYLSDDFTNPTKFAFPADAVIDPKSFLIVWADEDSITPGNIHCNFKISGDGEELLLSDIDGNIFDSVSFGPQAVDVSSGRCPDGMGLMEILPSTTFNSANCESGVNEPKNLIDLWIYPNPTQAFLVIKNRQPQLSKVVEIYDISNKLFYTGILDNELIIDTSDWTNGIYLVKANLPETVKIIIKH